jgi:hypothetical protein
MCRTGMISMSQRVRVSIYICVRPDEDAAKCISKTCGICPHMLIGQICSSNIVTPPLVGEKWLAALIDIFRVLLDIRGIALQLCSRIYDLKDI